MTRARRMRAARVASNSPVGQAEYYTPGVYDIVVPDGVDEIHAVGVAAGENTNNIPPGSSTYPGGWGGNNHWCNNIPVTPGEVLTGTVGVAGTLGSGLSTRLKRGDTLLIDARGYGSETQHGTIGGGGGKGGPGGNGPGGDGGLGGGAGGYAGSGGRGGSYSGTNGTLPETDSGGGRGGDMDGVPTGWANTTGEGVGLLGRSPDKQSSLGPRKVGGGGTPNGGAVDGGLRIMFGNGRSYPDNAGDREVTSAASFVTSSSGQGSLPQAISLHVGAEPGDIVLLQVVPLSSGGISSIGGGANWKSLGGLAFWKQITQSDIDASVGGTLTIAGSLTCSWGLVVYRGGMVLHFRASGAGSDTVTIPGVTKRVDCKRVVAVAYDSDVTTIPNPTGFTSRLNRTGTGALRFSDKAPADYNGEPVVYTGMGVNQPTGARLFEIY